MSMMMKKFKSGQTGKRIGYLLKGDYGLYRHDDGYSVWLGNKILVCCTFRQWKAAKAAFYELTER
jgi:hypothetical protein